MKLYAFVNPGMEDFCKQEIKEILAVSGKVYSQVVEFDASAEQALTLLYHGQSMRRIVASLGKYKTLDEAVFNSVSWKDFILSSSFKAEVENVKGIENRLALAKTVAGKVFSAVDKQKLSLTINLK